MFYYKINNDILSSTIPLLDTQYISIAREEYEQLLQEKALFREDSFKTILQINTIF